MLDMVNDGRGHVRLEYEIPTRGLIGLRNAFLTAIKGNGVLASRLIGYEPWQGPIGSAATARWSPGRRRALGTAWPTRRSAASPSSRPVKRSTRA